MQKEKIIEYYLHIIYENDFYGMGLAFEKSGDLIGVLSYESVIKIKQNSNIIQENKAKYLIIDPIKKTNYNSKEEKKAINNFNKYFLRIFKENSPIIDTYNLFGKHLNATLNQLNDSGIILDLGGGNGKYLKQNFEKAIIYDLSIDRNTSLKTKRKLPTIFRIQGDAEYLAFKENSFSLVLCNFLLEHVPDTFEIISQSHHVLKSGGILLISIPSLDLSETINVFLLRKNLTLPIFHIRLFGIFSRQFCESLLSLVKFLKMSGFTILNIEAVNIIKSETRISCLINNLLKSVFPFKYLGAQTIIIAKKNEPYIN